MHNCNHYVEPLTSDFVCRRTSGKEKGCFVGILIGSRVAIDLSGTFGFF